MVSAAIKELEDMNLQVQMKKHPKFPKAYLTKKKYALATANGLTSAVIDFINLKTAFIFI